ncbi:class I SAM-dependent methyltransferase [Amycolatopsis sacchari]|uniref:Methyltransferase domain-containing protein n=1 Tax=Amycolatopsis sacchari TaxID=115433 RepID=A0A1I4DN66_9PSEU|nr:methyltransferase domain-containing protein [Amycolatopsis sacchari]SFK94715.1 Methyltransferase domain-containing protein [Amycolatopsis sacchari]
MTDEYVMGRNTAETERLRVQGAIFAEHSAHLFRLAGIAPGMRVLDVGCGAGDVSRLLSGIVGPAGSVLGVDVDAAVLDVAATRADEAGLSNVSFMQADLRELRLDERVDALAGRLILMHLPEPAETVRALSHHVRPGGMVTFQECVLSRCRSVPPTPLLTKTAQWVFEAVRSGGADPDTGDRVSSILTAAGLPVRGIAAAGAGGLADSAMPGYFAATARSVLPLAVAHGLVSEAEAAIDDLEGRLAEEFRAAEATAWTADLVAAWAEVA